MLTQLETAQVTLENKLEAAGAPKLVLDIILAVLASLITVLCPSPVAMANACPKLTRSMIKVKLWRQFGKDDLAEMGGDTFVDNVLKSLQEATPEEEAMLKLKAKHNH